MQRWKEEFSANTQRKCVHVHPNGDFEHGKVLYMETDWSYLDFLNAASQRLNMAPVAKRLFNADGVEIDDCMMIEDDDILFLSIHEDFIAPLDTLADNSDPLNHNGRCENEKIPSLVGGFKVGELLGRGGFGEVRIGEHHLTGERVALKFLRKAEIQSFGAAERTNIEIQCLTALKHQNIIRLQQHMESAHHVVLVFELMEGGDLLKYLIRGKQSGARQKANLSEEEARLVFYQVLSAISYAHNQHICHRDLKLENILLKDSTLNIVKIADFGLSDFYRPGALIKSSCGTLSFLAPEVFRGTANAGPPLDIWAMGVILFALLCGRLPFEGADLMGTKRPREAVIKARIMKCQFKLDENLGPEAKDLVRRMLQLDPAERITIPEVFNHVWVRIASSNHWVDSHQTNNPHSQISPRPNNNNIIGSALTNHIHTGYDANRDDSLSPFAAPAKAKRGNSNPSDQTNYPSSSNNEFKYPSRGSSNLEDNASASSSSIMTKPGPKRELSTSDEAKLIPRTDNSEESSSVNSKQSSRTDLDVTPVAVSAPLSATVRNRSRSSDEAATDQIDIIKEINSMNLLSEPLLLDDLVLASPSAHINNTADAKAPASTIKLIPLRRNNEVNQQSKLGLDDDDLFSPVSRSYPPETTPVFRESKTIASGGKRQIGGLLRPEDCSSPIGGSLQSLSNVSSPTLPVSKASSSNLQGVAKDILRSVSPRIDYRLSSFTPDPKEKDTLYNFTKSTPNVGSLSNNSSLSELRRPSAPSALQSSTTDLASPIGNTMRSSTSHHGSHHASAGLNRKDHLNPSHARHPIQASAGLASLQSHSTVLKMGNSGSTFSPQQHHHHLSETSSPISSPITILKKNTAYNNSPSQNTGVKARFS